MHCMHRPFTCYLLAFLLSHVFCCPPSDHCIVQVVALHKEHYVFPLTIAVTKVSGSGTDAIFMGVLKHLPEEADTVKAWIMPAGGASVRQRVVHVPS